RPIHNVHLDRLRGRTETQDGIAAPVPAQDTAAIEMHSLEKAPARRLDDGTLDLIADAVRVHHLTAVHGRNNAPQPDPPGLMLNLQRQRDRTVGTKVLVACESKPPALPGTGPAE